MIKNFEQFVNEQKLIEASYGNLPWETDIADDTAERLLDGKSFEVYDELESLKRNYREYSNLMGISEIIAGIYKWVIITGGVFNRFPIQFQKMAIGGLRLVIDNPNLLNGHVSDVKYYIEFFKNDISKVIK